jgi:hypothetical protein
MAQPVKSSELLALSHRPTSDRGPCVVPVGYHDGRSVQTATGHRLGGSNLLERTVQPAEVAQARIFEGILQAEFAELRHLAYRISGSLDRQPDLNGHEASEDLRRLHERIDEVQRLLEALRGRFPHPRWDGELQPE